MKKYLIIITCVALITLFVKGCYDRNEIVRLRQNYNVLVSESGEALNLTKSEFKKIAPKFAVLLSAVKVKTKHVKQLILFAVHDTIHLWSDTVIVLNNESNPTDTFNFTIFNPCYTVHGYYDGVIDAELIRTDSLYCVVDLKRSKSFLGLFRYGCWTSRGYLYSTCSGKIDSSKFYINVNR